MTEAELQYAIGTAADGVWGPKSKAALLARFTNRQAAAVTIGQMQAIADRLGCSLRQIAAVAAVESRGGGFDAQGRPKILFERHIFHRLTNGAFSPAPYSQRVYGGYGEDSWAKLADAAGRNPDAAFSACSWGRFQVMGMHWRKLGYASAYELAASTVASELAHFELLARYIETFGLKDQLRRLSPRAADCALFAQAYNGPDFKRNGYDAKLARAMA